MQKEKKNEKKTVFVKEKAKKPGKDVTRPQKTRKTARTAESKRIDGNKKAKTPLYEKKSEKPTSRNDRSASFEIIEPQKTLPQKKKAPTHERSGKLKVISLGGLQEIGKNITLFEYGNDIVVIDCGMGFPDEEMPGIDLVIPDFSYLKANADKVRAILVTHGHEDHIGAIPYLLREINAPVYGTRLSLGILEGKLDEIRPPNDPDLYTVEAGDVINLGVFKAEFIHVNHSIADACAIALRTPVGTVFHSGDFKLDVSPIDDRIMDLTRIGEIGREGVKLLLCESTNAERQGFTPSERTVGSSLERIFAQYEDKRLIIATFSSNVHRVQQIIDASAKHGRKVAILGRSMVNVIGAAAELGYMDLPDGVLIDVADIKRYRPSDITLITTGSQGEPMSALYRIAFAEHEKVKLTTEDVVVLSASAIPGNEKLVNKIINALIRSGVRVVNDSVEDVHVSGHACREEIKLLLALLRPEYFMPIHGEFRHLYANKDIAEFMGIPSKNIFISEIGQVLEVDKKGVRFNGSVPAGKILVDGSGVGDIGAVVLRDRKHLAEDGLVVVVMALDLSYGMIVSGPDIVSRGFVYVKEAELLIMGAKKVVETSLSVMLGKRVRDAVQIKNVVKDDLAKYIYKETKRRPMILPIIMDVC
ncbi:MAG: RNase J family beta-CASP ribonuclease [Clostridia bacterium]|nr:RNase J family beta-CASP ribonuclease [Clostridia bacterium]